MIVEISTTIFFDNEIEKKYNKKKVDWELLRRISAEIKPIQITTPEPSCWQKGH
jgi:hypothetical protein